MSLSLAEFPTMNIANVVLAIHGWYNHWSFTRKNQMFIWKVLRRFIIYYQNFVRFFFSLFFIFIFFFLVICLFVFQLVCFWQLDFSQQFKISSSVPSGLDNNLNLGRHCRWGSRAKESSWLAVIIEGDIAIPHRR